MANATQRNGFTAAQRYRRAAIASILVGTTALIIAGQVGYGLAGLVVYAALTLVGFGTMAFVRLSDSLSLGDERLCELERRASHYAVATVGLVGWIGLVGASLLEATGQRAMTATEETLLVAFGAFFLVWGVIYVALRLRG